MAYLGPEEKGQFTRRVLVLAQALMFRNTLGTH